MYIIKKYGNISVYRYTRKDDKMLNYYYTLKYSNTKKVSDFQVLFNEQKEVVRVPGTKKMKRFKEKEVIYSVEDLQVINVSLIKIDGTKYVNSRIYDFGCYRASGVRCQFVFCKDGYEYSYLTDIPENLIYELDAIYGISYIEDTEEKDDQSNGSVKFSGTVNLPEDKSELILYVPNENDIQNLYVVSKKMQAFAETEDATYDYFENAEEDEYLSDDYLYFKDSYYYGAYMSAGQYFSPILSIISDKVDKDKKYLEWKNKYSSSNYYYFDVSYKKNLRTEKHEYIMEGTKYCIGDFKYKIHKDKYEELINLYETKSNDKEYQKLFDIIETHCGRVKNKSPQFPIFSYFEENKKDYESDILKVGRRNQLSVDTIIIQLMSVGKDNILNIMNGEKVSLSGEKAQRFTKLKNTVRKLLIKESDAKKEYTLKDLFENMHIDFDKFVFDANKLEKNHIYQGIAPDEDFKYGYEYSLDALFLDYMYCFDYEINNSQNNSGEKLLTMKPKDSICKVFTGVNYRTHELNLFKNIFTDCSKPKKINIDSISYYGSDTFEKYLTVYKVEEELNEKGFILYDASDEFSDVIEDVKRTSFKNVLNNYFTKLPSYILERFADVLINSQRIYDIKENEDTLEIRYKDSYLYLKVENLLNFYAKTIGCFDERETEKLMPMLSDVHSLLKFLERML